MGVALIPYTGHKDTLLKRSWLGVIAEPFLSSDIHSGMIDRYPTIQLEAIVNTEPDEDENTTPPPPTEEEKATETPNDPPKKEPEPAPQPDNGLAERIETLEKEVSALKAMMDTLGFEAADHNGSDNDKPGPEDSGITIEDLF